MKFFFWLNTRVDKIILTTRVVYMEKDIIKRVCNHCKINGHKTDVSENVFVGVIIIDVFVGVIIIVCIAVYR